VQIHYNPIATGSTYRTRTKVELSSTIARAASYLAVAPERSVSRHGSPTPTSRDPHRAARLAHPRVAPRMHTLGKTMQLERSERLETAAWKCMSSFDHWNFYRSGFSSLTPDRSRRGRAHPHFVRVRHRERASRAPGKRSTTRMPREFWLQMISGGLGSRLTTDSCSIIRWSSCSRL